MVQVAFGMMPIPAPSPSSASTLPSLPAFNGDTLLLPAVSIGSVPQLAFDLLVHATDLNLQRAARVKGSKWCAPFAGPIDAPSTTKSNQPPAPNDITTALELYRSPEHRVTLLHQRSPVLKSQKDEFITALLEWVKTQEFSQVVLVASLDAGLRVDPEFATPVLHWAPEGQQIPPGLLQFISANTPAFSPKPLLGTQDMKAKSSKDVPPLPGSGMTRRILHAAQAQGLTTPIGALLLFAGEGDNRGDAHALAGLISKGLAAAGQGEFVEPVSWQSMFGPRFDQSLYG